MFILVLHQNVLFVSFVLVDLVLLFDLFVVFDLYDLSVQFDHDVFVLGLVDVFVFVLVEVLLLGLVDFKICGPGTNILKVA